MKKGRILIVEDEVIIATDIQEMLEEMDYEVVDINITAKEALNTLSTKKVDLVLLDIFIKGNKDGIELALEIRKNYSIPFIFLTSHSDPKTVEKAIASQPNGYIVKPFDKADLYTSVALGLNKIVTSNPKKKGEFEQLKDHIFIKDSHNFIKVKFNELLWLKSTGNYVELHCLTKKLLVRSTIKELIAHLPSHLFFQIHKSYSVNYPLIDSFNSHSVFINEHELPIGRAFKRDLTTLLTDKA